MIRALKSMIRARKGRNKVMERFDDIMVDITNYGQEKISLLNVC